MPATSSSDASLSSTLLLRLRRHEPEAWQRMTHLFGPLVYQWCRRSGLRPVDAADVVQEVFRSVSLGLKNFRHDRPGDTFRGWIATITRNRICDHFRREHARPHGRGGTDFQRRMLDLPQADEDASLDGNSNASAESRGVMRRALDLVRAEFEDRTWQAFWRTVVSQQAPSDAAEDLGISVNAVYKAKSRILKRLREELAGLFD